MKKLFNLIKVKNLRFIILAGFVCLSLALKAQTMTGATIITPVCPTGSGTVQVSFTNATYPFTLSWYGNGITTGSAVITGSPQTITIAGSTTNGFWGNSGTIGRFFIANNKNLGNFPVGISFDPAARQVTATCSAGATFTINNITGGTGPYSLIVYNKTTGSNIASGTSPLNVAFANICPNSQNIGLRVQDANGCYTSMDSMYIYCQGLNVQTSATMASCTNGSAQVTSVSGGVSPYSYLWSNGATSSTITGLSRGQYICTVTDANNCNGQGYAYVEQNPNISVNTTTKPANCNNPDGEATAFATGGAAPYTYLWDNGSTTQSVTNLYATGNYQKVKVTDANNCTGEGYVYITSLSPVYVNYITTPSACTSATGTATLNVSGGTAPYTYVWYGNTSTTNVASGLAVGDYSFKVTDANGCERTGTVSVPPISQISATINTINAICPNTTGSLAITATSSAMPLTYNWSNGSTSSSITNVNTGSYTCTITDANSCYITKYGGVSSRSPIKLNYATTQASCIFTADGTATVYPIGGTAPYSYLWNNGATTAAISGLTTGYYWVTVTDANGCSSYGGYVKVGYNEYSNTCYCTIKGVVYNDINSNCTQDNGEDGIANVLINGGTLGYTLTDDNGNYSFKAPIGNYTITEILNNGVSLSSCQTNAVAVNISSISSGCSNTLNFANQLVPKHDIHTFMINKNAPVPGNNYYQTMVIKNSGNITENNIQAGYKHEGQLVWQNSYATPLVSAGTNYFNLNAPITLKKGKSAIYTLDYFTPTNIPMGTLVYFRDSAAYQSPISTYWITNEETPWNNINDLYTTVVSSYDPNYKAVFPKGAGDDGRILLSQKDFTYVIHFENNGTAPAQKIVVIDTLDTDFDVESFRTLDASHGVVTNIKGRTVTFTFNQINLDFTPKGVYKASAQGYVAYTIKAKNTLQLGTTLLNNADIYFDYNSPIRTNTTINTYSANISHLNTIKANATNILAYPNPANNQLNLLLPNTFSGKPIIEILNMQGQLMNDITVDEESLALNISTLTSGIYVVKVTDTNGKNYCVKFIKQ